MTKKKSIELALQGGGSHGALTWGVLERLLEEKDLKIEGISGTSAGAMNAVVLAHGMQTGGADGAIALLHKFWKNVSEYAVYSPLQRDIWSRLNGNWNLENSPAYIFLDHFTRIFSPYEINPFDVNPLRDIVASIIDFDCVNKCTKIKVFVTATNVRTGRAKIFSQPDLSIDALMASASLPFIFKAVEIDGEAYWDGGYTGNPALFPLIERCDSRDLILIQINPFYRQELPRTSREIISRVNEITFNANLIKELRSVMLLRDMVNTEKIDRDHYKNMRLHRIHADKDLSDLNASSKLNAEWSYLCHLRDMGRIRTDNWLKQHWDDLGSRETFNPEWMLFENIKACGQAIDINDVKKEQ